MANVFDTAKYICMSFGDQISTMKLQKLCYYAQAWQLVWTQNERSLFPEEFEKWEGGPVCRELFEVHRGKFFIDEHGIPSSKLSSEGLTPYEMESIDKVLESYGGYDCSQLSELTHSEAPWKNTAMNSIITKKMMYDYYSGVLANE